MNATLVGAFFDRLFSNKKREPHGTQKKGPHGAGLEGGRMEQIDYRNFTALNIARLSVLKNFP